MHGITGDYFETKWQVDLSLRETSPRTFFVVNSLPMNCDVLLGQDWLERYGY